MGKDEMRARYGKGHKGRALYNAAIRAECPGGPDLLDLMELVSAMRGRTGSAEEAEKLRIIDDRLQTVRERMLIAVRNRWGLIDE